MKRIYDLVHANGNYKDRDGNEKTRWLKSGAVFEKEGGNLVLKLDAVPVVSEGWFQLFKVEEASQPVQPRDTVIDDEEPINLSDVPF